MSCPIKKEENKIYIYFAYGSNMSRGRLENQNGNEQVIGSVIDCGISILRGHELRFNKRSIDGSGKANIVLNEKSEVLGVIYKLTRRQLNLLDSIERGYRRHPIQVNFQDKIISAETYIAALGKTDDSLLPQRDYLGFLICGAREHRFPREYMQFLESMQILVET